MDNSLHFCNVRKFCQKRYVFVDEEGIYYFWQFWFGEYGISVEIKAFKKEVDRFVKIETKKVEELVAYLKLKVSSKNTREIRKFCKYISALNYTVPKSIVKKFGQRFCNCFLHDKDQEFIVLDPNAKHWVIDFDKVKNYKSDFLKEPELFPFTITETGVTLTAEETLVKDGRVITIEEFWRLDEAYRRSLIPIIKSKDRIMRKIEEDLKRRYERCLKELERNKKISDFEIEPKIDIYDTSLGDATVGTCYYDKEIFEDERLYTLQHYGIDIEVGRLCRYMIDTLGLRSIHRKFSFWSEIEMRDQKFFEF